MNKRKREEYSHGFSDKEAGPCEEMKLDTRPHKPRIIRVRFGIANPEEIRRMATVSIHETSIFDKTVPKAFGVNDLRMGTIDRRFRCGTCGKGLMECVGHTGCLELAFPIYHISFLPTVVKILSCICYFCCTCLIDKSLITSSGSRVETKLQKFVKMKKASICPNPDCGGPQPHYTSVVSGHEIAIKIEWKEAILKYGKHLAKTSNEVGEITDFREMLLPLNNLAKRGFTAADAGHILNGIDEETCRVMGLDYIQSHPKNMILSCLLVPSPIIRPAAMTSEGRPRNHDDLTEKLKDIVLANENVKSTILSATNGERDSLDSTSYILRDKAWTTTLLASVKDLQYQVAVLFNNEVRGLKTDRQRSGAATKSISVRLKGKEGRFRGNVCGKRVNFSARSVISPDPNIDLDQVGVPHHIAITLTYPERVNRWNIESLMTRIRHGADCLEGAQNYIKLDGTKIDLRHVENRERLRLRFGDIVERYRQNGDTVIFNRLVGRCFSIYKSI